MKPLRHFQERFYITLFVFFLPLGHIAIAQSNLFLNFQSTSLDFPSLSERDVKYSNQFFLHVTNPNSGDENNYVLKLEIQGSGIRMNSIGKPGSGMSFKLSSQLTFLSSDLAHFFDLDELDLTGISHEEYLLNGLPEGIYTLCFTVFDNTFDRNQAASNQACLNLFVRENLPPKIIQPYDEQVFLKNDQHLFQWMPRHITTSPVNYHLLVYDDLEGITPQELVSHFRPLIDEETFGLQYFYHAASQKLKPGRKYVAFVWVESIYHHAKFKNGGFSEPIHFEIEPGIASHSRTPEGQIPEPNCFYPASDVIINEFNSGQEGGRGVFIELLVTGLQSAQTEYDLEGWIIDDNNYFPSNPYANSGHFRLGSCLNDIPRGSLVLIYDHNLHHPLINTAMDGMPNANGVYQIRFSDACNSITENCPDISDNHYSCTPQTTMGAAWPAYLTFNNPGDLIQLRRPDGDLEHTFIWNTDDYELIASEKTIDFNIVNFSTGLGLAFTSGSDWYAESGYSVINSSQATPGTGNNSANISLITDIGGITDHNPFYISCAHRILGNSSWAVIDIYGYTSNSSFKVYVDGVPVIDYSINNPIQVKLQGEGFHIIKVVDLYTNCEDEGIVEVPSECVPGTPCDDLNSCTSNDVLDVDCMCAGVSNDEVIFTTQIASQQNCNFCISLTPTDYDPLIGYFIIESITLEIPTGGTLYFNELDNFDDDRNRVFNFPYCIGCSGSNDLTLLISNFNEWLLVNGYSGSVSQGPSPCGTNSLIFTNTNVTFESAEAVTNIGDDFEINFTAYDCADQPSGLGYFITANLENCGEIGPDNTEEITSWIWSTGSVEDYIFSYNLDDCYSVSITCSTGCTYQGIFPAGGAGCECIIGSPCIVSGPEPLECRSGILDQNCNCILQPVPDSDGDGICDLVDECPGFNDIEDSDSDGVPDGCDTEEYPCNEEVSINVTSLEHATCDYCLQVDATTTFPNDPFRYFKSILFTIDGEPAQMDLMTDWEEYNSQGFELAWGSWNSGGNHANRFENVQLANNGRYSVELKSNGTSASISTNSFSLSSCCQIQFDLSFIAKDFQSGESFYLEVSTNNGNTYTIAKEFQYGTGALQFTNDKRYNETVFINSPFSSVTKFRIRSNSFNTTHRIYLDDIIIRRISNTGYGCFSTDNDRTQFVSAVYNWLYQAGEYVDMHYVTGFSPVCGTGDFILASNSTVPFHNLSIIGNGSYATYIFPSPDCGFLLPGEESYLLTAQSTCLDASYEWTTGQTTSSIQIANEDAGYNVTITCEDECSYIVEHGNQNCIVGSPCIRPNDPCNPIGFIDENCDCVPEVYNTIDLDGNGIPDCKEVPCDCVSEPEITYTESAVTRYNLCLDISGINDYISGATITFPNEVPIDLTDPVYFEYEYCIGTGGILGCNSLERRSFDEFRSHLYRWGLKEGHDMKVFIETDNFSNCGEGTYLRIENAPFNKLELTLTALGTIETQEQPAESSLIVGYSVGVNLADCNVCAHPAYLWSDGSTASTPFTSIVSSPGIGFSVTVTCSQNCIYVKETDEEICIVGTPCDDGYNCTTDDAFNEYCICTGTIIDDNDDDDDGVVNTCDQCPGFNDGMDDDGDTVPNGCDCYPGQNDAEQPAVDCTPPCSFGGEPYSIQLVTSYILLDKNWCATYPYIGGFSYCMPEDPNCITPEFVSFYYPPNPYFKMGYCYCSNCSVSYFGVEDFVIDLENWLINIMGDENASVEFTDGVLYIHTSYLKFHKLYLDEWVAAGDSEDKNFSHEYGGTIDFGSPCDDGDICTVFDRWDENCRCVGIYEDSDGDGVCDEEELCPGELDYIDFDEDGIPDCLENQLVECEGGEIEICEFFKKLLEATYGPNNQPVVVNESELDGSPVRVIQKNNRVIQEMLYNYFAETNWAPLNMNYPQLIYDLKTNHDTDGDGLVDYLDPCPGIPGQNSIPTGEYLTVNDFDLSQNPNCGCDTKTWENMVVLYRLLFETVSFINEIGTLCYKDDGPEVQPACAVALGILVYEDENCVLRAQDGDCAIEFRVNCNGECEPVYLGLYDPPDENEVPDCTAPVDVSVTCDPSYVTCPDPPACTEMKVIVNSEGECECVVVATYDSDGDGICDDEDHCPEIIFEDIDGDGIDDCIDDCPNTPGMRGEPCDDFDPCTYADRIDENCNCVGFSIDLDDDTVYDCEPCDAAKDNDGDGFIDEVILVNGLPKCDVCPGLDDRLDWDGDGIPDCLDPPYNPIGCPTGFAVVKETGIVLIFDSEEILREDLPEPVSAWLMGQFTGSGDNSYKFFPYLLISNIRETAGTFEVLYRAENFSPSIVAEKVRMVGITYADHQQCFFDDLDDDDILIPSEETFVELPCPDFITVPADDQIQFHFNIDPGYTIDPAGLVGALELGLSSSAGSSIPTPLNIQPQNIRITSTGIKLTFGDITGLAATSTYSGSITLPNGIVCTYLSGGSPTEDCIIETVPYTVGDPCDDGDPCTHHDRLNNACECVGDPSPDRDNDEICDEVDPCPDVSNDPLAPDLDGDGYPDCPCPGLIVESFELVNGNDLEITLNMMYADQFSHIDVSMSGGPEEWDTTGMAYSNPFIIPNLPYGYVITLTLNGVCLTGGISGTQIEQVVPFGEDQFVCGIKIEEFDLQSLSLLASLQSGEVFYAADFEIKARNVQGQYGKYTGDGYIKVPYLQGARINVSYDNITISASRQMVVGKIKVDGFGIAVLGDDLSDAINGAINTILDPLIELNGILEELIPLLDALDKLVETTGHLVSEETKNCLINAQNNLEALQSQQPAATVEEMQAAVATLKACQLAYDQELADIINNLLALMDAIVDEINLTCGQSQIDDYNEVQNFPEDKLQTTLLQLSNAFPPGGSGLDLYGEDVKRKIEASFNPSDFNDYTELQEFYNREGEMLLCKMVEIMNSPEYALDITKSKALVVALLDAGVEFIKEFESELKMGIDPHQIYNTNSTYIREAMKKYLSYYLYHKS